MPVMCNNCFGEGCGKCGGSGEVAAPSDAAASAPVAVPPDRPSGDLEVIIGAKTDSELIDFFRKHEGELAERTRIFRSVAEAARAEADAITEVRRLKTVKDSGGSA